jgi:hypothetical protein
MRSAGDPAPALALDRPDPAFALADEMVIA